MYANFDVLRLHRYLANVKYVNNVYLYCRMCVHTLCKESINCKQIHLKFQVLLK